MKPTYKGIYFLYKGNETVYIGQSTDVFRRIYEHAHSRSVRGHDKSDFDSWKFVEIEDKALREWLEETLIELYKPKLNIEYLQKTLIPRHSPMPGELGTDDWRNEHGKYYWYFKDIGMCLVGCLNGTMRKDFRDDFEALLYKYGVRRRGM